MRKTWAEIEALDTKVPAKLQYSMAFQTSRLLRHVTYWLLAHRRLQLPVDAAVAEFPQGLPPPWGTSAGVSVSWKLKSSPGWAVRIGNASRRCARNTLKQACLPISQH